MLHPSDRGTKTIALTNLFTDSRSVGRIREAAQKGAKINFGEAMPHTAWQSLKIERQVQ